MTIKSRAVLIITEYSPLEILPGSSCFKQHDTYLNYMLVCYLNRNQSSNPEVNAC